MSPKQVFACWLLKIIWTIEGKSSQLLKQQAKQEGKSIWTIESLHQSQLPPLVLHVKIVCNMLLISASSSQNKLGLLPSSTFFSFDYDERESQQVKAIYWEYMPKQSMKPELDAWYINIGKCHNQQSWKIKPGHHKLENVALADCGKGRTTNL